MSAHYETYLLCSSAPNSFSYSALDMLRLLLVHLNLEHLLQVLNFSHAKPLAFHRSDVRLIRLRTKAWSAFHFMQL